MSRTARTRPVRASLLTGALVGALAVTGCGAGQVANTAGQVAASQGANVAAGTIVVRDAVITYGEEAEGSAIYTRGADAPLSMTIVNEGSEADELVSASSVWAREVRIAGDAEVPAGRALVVEGESAASGSAAPSGAPATPSDAPSAAPSGGPVAPAGTEGTQVVLTGLLDDLRAGLTYEVVLTFERAGELRVRLPIGANEKPRVDEMPGEEGPAE